MKIYVDGLFYKASGIGRYYEFLVRGLTERGCEIYTAVPERLKEEFSKDFGDLDSVKALFVPYEKFSPRAFFSQGQLLASLKNKVSHFIYPHVNVPLQVPKNVIVTVHDLIPLTKYWEGSKINRLIFKSFVGHSVRYATSVITISHQTEKQVAELFPKAANKTVTIYRTFEPKLRQMAQDSFENPVGALYFLYVGNRKKHKNLEPVLKALSLVEDNGTKFVVAGPKEGSGQDEIERLADQLCMKERVQFFVSPSDEMLASLYKNARFLIQPSLIEGFGLPPLEALSFGVPVLLSDIPIFREIYEDVPEYFDPLSVEDIAGKLRRWVDRNANLSVEPANVSRILSKFDREKVLDSYISLLEEAEQ